MIGFIAQDMGGANLVLHHAHFFRGKKLIFAYGPAKELAKTLNLTLEKPSNFELKEIIAGANSKNSNLESDKTLVHFNKMDIPINGYLDGWQFYDERFLGLDINYFYVTDKFAEAIAIDLFPNKVRMMPNFYFEKVEKDFMKLKNNFQNKSNFDVLYFTQPKISNRDNIFNLEHGQNCICFDLITVKKNLDPSCIIVRDHVNLNSSICLDYFSKLHKLFIVRSNAFKPLAEDLHISKVVCGAPTPALYFASELKFETYVTQDLPRNWQGPNFKILS
jgi:hypothetical protein